MDYKKEDKFLRITDFFSEDVRVKCHFNKNISPYDWYQENKKEAIKKFGNKVDYNTIDNYIWSNTKACSNFPVTVSLFLLKTLKVKRWLDPSAGWGDRLLSAINYGCEYHGFDPNTAMAEKYQDMIDTFGDDKYLVETLPFEKSELQDNYYDLVFTSPPFFTLEVYSAEKTQCYLNYNTLDKWLNNFLFPLIKKAEKCLTKGGHLGLYISDYRSKDKNINYVKRVKDYTKENTALKYQGELSWSQGKGKRTRDIFLWQK